MFVEKCQNNGSDDILSPFTFWSQTIFIKCLGRYFTPNTLILNSYIKNHNCVTVNQFYMHTQCFE